MSKQWWKSLGLVGICLIIYCCYNMGAWLTPKYLLKDSAFKTKQESLASEQSPVVDQTKESLTSKQSPVVDQTKESLASKQSPVVDQTKESLASEQSPVKPESCDVACEAGIPCEYPDEVDFRVIVIAYDRSDSLRKCLDSVGLVDTLGDRVRVDIWLDRSAKGLIHPDTYTVAVNFTRHWQRGRGCVHNQTAHVNIGGQWIDTWRPKPQTKEVALILEDDVDISPNAYKWLKATAAVFHSKDDISGYTLQMKGLYYRAGQQRPMVAPATDNVFLYGILGSWGFSPRPQAWRDFQDWYHSKDPSLKPYVPGIDATNWYKRFERGKREATMWTMWHIYHSYVQGLYCVYCNLREYTGEDVLLSANRKEKGLHFKGSTSNSESYKLLMTNWDPKFVVFPNVITRYSYNGTVIHATQ